MASRRQGYLFANIKSVGPNALVIECADYHKPFPISARSANRDNLTIFAVGQRIRLEFYGTDNNGCPIVRLPQVRAGQR